MTTKKVSFTPEKLKKFRTAYKNAVDSKKDVFVFEGNGFVTEYAKYMIQYLDTKFGVQ
jgi:basic membrane lipoprotein Med (substrate-binding protein (PBP1-ABC) superfamily)